MLNHNVLVCMKTKYSIIVPLYKNFELIDLLTSTIIKEIAKIKKLFSTHPSKKILLRY